MVKALLALIWLAGPALAGPVAQVPTVPSSAIVLARARQAQVPMPQMAATISASASVVQAVQAMEALGVLKPGEVNAADAGQALAMRHVLQAVWRETSSSIKGPEVDGAWAVPAVVVRAPEATYYLHGTSHGLSGGLGGRAVRRLETQVSKAGAPLLVEQSLPATYRLKKAQEVIDRPEDRAAPAFARWAARLLPLGRSFHRFYFGLLARAADRQGNADLAAHMRAVAERLYGRRADPARAAGLELPLPLKEEVEPQVVARSRALADAALAAAEQAGGVIHVLSGWSHVPDLAALLSPKNGS